MNNATLTIYKKPNIYPVSQKILQENEEVDESELIGIESVNDRNMLMNFGDTDENNPPIKTSHHKSCKDISKKNYFVLPEKQSQKEEKSFLSMQEKSFKNSYRSPSSKITNKPSISNLSTLSKSK